MVTNKEEEQWFRQMGKQICLFLLFSQEAINLFYFWFLSINRSAYYGEWSYDSVCGVV